MFEIREIRIKEALGYDIKHPLYNYFGVFQGVDLVATLIVKFEDNLIHFLSIDKKYGTPHGIFEFILKYFEENYNGKKIYLESYVPKLCEMYMQYGFKKISKFTYIKQI